MPPSPKPNEIILRDAKRGAWLRFCEPQTVLTASRVEDVIPQLRALDEAVENRGLWAAGFIAYEAAPAFDAALAVRPDGAFPLVWFGLYEKVEEIETLDTEQDEAAVPDLVWTDSIAPEAYRRAIDKIRGYIRDGDTYQVNFTFRLNAPCPADPWALFARLVRAHNPPYGAFVLTDDWAVCSASPELFFELDGEEIRSLPMKGTAPRGLTCEDDLERAAALRRSEKDRAENIMIADMVRNDLGRIARIGSVQAENLFAVERYPTVWQMTSNVRAKTSAAPSEILRALFPPASVTGAPKMRTMQIIAELETAPRRIYTGAIGYFAPNRRAQFNVAIRTILVDLKRQTAEYGVGGGIVWDSTAEKEWEECRVKARVLAPPAPEFSLLETLLWTPEEGYCLLQYHLARLLGSAAYFAFPANEEAIRQELDSLATRLPRAAHRVRLLVSRKGEAACTAQLFEASAPGSIRRVCLARAPVDSSNPFLYHKTTNRKVYEEAMAACPGFDDVILWNERREVTESAIANLVVEIEGQRYTPPIRCGVLPGCYRAWMLETGAAQERVITIDEFLRADRVFVVNSVRGEQQALASQPD